MEHLLQPLGCCLAGRHPLHCSHGMPGGIACCQAMYGGGRRLSGTSSVRALLALAQLSQWVNKMAAAILCVREGMTSTLAAHIRLFPKHVSISPLRYSGSLRCYKSCNSKPVSRSANHAAGTPAVMTAGVAQQLQYMIVRLYTLGQRQEQR